MKIALLGYGKMGKTIEQIAINRNHQISFKTNHPATLEDLKNAEVAIDFSFPNSAVNNIKLAIDAQVPVISGTTGWLKDYHDVVNYCKSKDGAFLYASNFSLGVNIFFELNRKLSQLISPFKDYNTHIVETHHTEKLDAPSGTAITLAEDIIKYTSYAGWSLDNPKPNEIGITSKRIEKLPGTHEIIYSSAIDDISIKHTAHNRMGFALGAVIAAEWIKGKKGVFNMNDVLNIG